MASNSTFPSLEPPDLLDDFHRRNLDTAIRNILSTPLAEFAFAQLLDGLPTCEVLTDIINFPEEDHPVFTQNHNTLCPGFIDKARKFRALFDSSDLRFDQWVGFTLLSGLNPADNSGFQALLAFQSAPFGSTQFNLRLIELVVVACHQIGAYLYELDQGNHKHSDYETWRDKVLEEQSSGVEERRFAMAHPTPFFHQLYQDFEQYPRGLAGMAGYWAESQIFGGVVVVERGETEKEVSKHRMIHLDCLYSKLTK